MDSVIFYFIAFFVSLNGFLRGFIDLELNQPEVRCEH